MSDPPAINPRNILRGVLAAFGVLALIVILGLGLLTITKAFGRYQQRADRNQARQQRIYDEQNDIQVNNIKIAQTHQLVQVAKQTARIRVANAVGLRDAQDEIAKTLTPLYIQFEAIQAQLAMARGHNHTMVWIPAGPNGVPVVSTVDPSEVK